MANTSRVCAYLTDVEGNLDYFHRYVDISKVLSWANEDKKQLVLAPDAEFVFGGDSQDKGIGDIRFVKLLIDLKRRYGDRVHLIIGNRDSNKLRLTTELAAATLTDESVLNDKSFPYWDPEAKRVTPAMFLTADTDKPKANTAVSRLRWILNHTMGSAGAFERRQEELSLIRNRHVSEDEVVQSYADEADPKAEENFMLTYLRLAQLAYIFGTTLFVHGAVTQHNMGSVPGRAGTIDNVQDWVQELNRWARQEVSAFMLDPYNGGNSKARAGHGLMDYGVPGGNDGKTVIYANNLVSGDPAPMPGPVQDYLANSGISGVVSGHKPHGDCPTVIQGKVVVITADTSYSQMGHKSAWGTDNRGDAVSEVLVYGKGRYTVHGKRADGSAISYDVNGPQGDSFVGRKLEESSEWVKAKYDAGDEPRYLLCRAEGFKLAQQNCTTAELAAKLGPSQGDAPRCWLLNQPGQQVSLSEVTQLGVFYAKLDPSHYSEGSNEKLETICREQGYTFRDFVDSSNIPNLEQKLEHFKTEHLHFDAEIRFFIKGSGYFDVKNFDDEFIRIHCFPGDLISLPRGLYHRFVPDDTMSFFVMRLFQGEPVWTAHNRSLPETEASDARQHYISTVAERMGGAVFEDDFDEAIAATEGLAFDDDFETTFAETMTKSPEEQEHELRDRVRRLQKAAASASEELTRRQAALRQATDDQQAQRQAADESLTAANTEKQHATDALNAVREQLARTVAQATTEEEELKAVVTRRNRARCMLADYEKEGKRAKQAADQSRRRSWIYGTLMLLVALLLLFSSHRFCIFYWAQGIDDSAMTAVLSKCPYPEAQTVTQRLFWAEKQHDILRNQLSSLQEADPLLRNEL